MASVINVGSLTLNPKEVENIGAFVNEQMFSQPSLSSLTKIMQGVKMKEQIVFASRMSKTGIADTGCARVTSSATSTLTQKYVEPLLVADTLIHCQADVNNLFKAYYNNIQNYREMFEIEGTDEAIFIAKLLEESARESSQRLAWLGDTAVQSYGAAQEGVAAGNVKFYDSVNGLWMRILAGVTATDISRVTITENTGATILAQKTLGSTFAFDLFQSIWANADSRLKARPDAKFLVNGWIWENYKNYLISKGIVYDINIPQNGLETLKFNGKEVVNMETVWDLYGFADWKAETTTNVYYLPNRVIFTVPDNLVVATLNEGNMTEIESFYDKITRQHYMAYGYTMDTQYLEGYMIEVAY